MKNKKKKKRENNNYSSYEDLKNPEGIDYDAIDDYMRE